MNPDNSGYLILKSLIVPSRLIIHAPNVHAGGGRSLLDAMLSCLPADSPTTLVADERLPIARETSSALRVKRVPATIRGRIGAERWLARNVSSEDLVLAFGNLPPLFRLRARVVVFLQNRYLIDKIEIAAFPIAARIRLQIERFWFASRVANVDEVIVQTPSMQRLLASRIGDKIKISMLPFVGPADRPDAATSPDATSDKKAYDFIYVASGEPHKNHRKLVEAWCLLAEEQCYPSLLLTVDQEKFTDLCDWISARANGHGLKIKNFGKFENGQLDQLYSEAGALIFASKVESFGLPLVEASKRGLKVLAPELDYVRDILDPQQSFDADSVISIARAVKRYLGRDQEERAIHDPVTFVEYLCGQHMAEEYSSDKDRFQ